MIRISGLMTDRGGSVSGGGQRDITGVAVHLRAGTVVLVASALDASTVPMLALRFESSP